MHQFRPISAIVPHAKSSPVVPLDHLPLLKPQCVFGIKPAFPFTKAYFQEIIFSEAEPSIMKTYDDTSPESGRIVKRLFCGRCGSPLCGIRGGFEDISILPIGIIDGDKSDLQPQSEFFHKSKVDWITPVVGSQCFETLPPVP